MNSTSIFKQAISASKIRTLACIAIIFSLSDASIAQSDPYKVVKKSSSGDWIVGGKPLSQCTMTAANYGSGTAIYDDCPTKGYQVTSPAYRDPFVNTDAEVMDIFNVVTEAFSVVMGIAEVPGAINQIMNSSISTRGIVAQAANAASKGKTAAGGAAADANAAAAAIFVRASKISKKSMEAGTTPHSVETSVRRAALKSCS
ncbi:hypothetical protein Bsp3421_002687 [Burkholderia sp. FERM BP-3421]|uniref:hypothetical protein n=1 Tax=Burkholderia sp. FERM BP-3421 TaxID=1494466 RepID=UPI00235E5E0E|nr:hypothetical protein [Burkholderia sp. FERM BP-3421]WDD92665.1 hypothetical protein Bsp3421_002687 [Burkholderia sp. FERM BP-3421]